MSARKVGILFADISGTTRLYRKIGAAEGARAVERCMKRIERAVEGFRGEVLMPASDEMLASFISAEDAVQAALDIQARLADLPPVSGVKLSARVGVHFGVAEQTAEGMAGAAIETARTLLSLSGADQILTCAQTAEALSPSLRRCLHTLDGMTLSLETGDCQVYAIVCGGHPDVTSTVIKPGALAPADPPSTKTPTLPPRGSTTTSLKKPASPLTGDRLCIRFGGKAYLLDARNTVLTIGREKENDIHIDDRKVSRRHARIELMPDHSATVTDSSTNGTFVAVTGAPDVVVHNETLTLRGAGRIAFGHPTTSTAALVADYEPL